MIKAINQGKHKYLYFECTLLNVEILMAQLFGANFHYPRVIEVY